MWIMWISRCISRIFPQIRLLCVEKKQESCVQKNVDNVDNLWIEHRFCAI